MCGRYSLIKLADVLASLPWIPPPPALDPPRYNIAPSQNILAAVSTPQPHFEHLHWGLIPSWAQDARVGYRMINARAESLTQRPAFRTALRERRCLIPADGFFEWQAGVHRQPWYIRLKSHQTFSFAGLWDTWQDIRSCTIITTQPNELVRGIYDRMPVLLTGAAQRAWLAQAPADIEKLLVPYPADEMEMYPVATLVNKPTTNSPNCIARAQPPGTLFN